MTNINGVSGVSYNYQFNTPAYAPPTSPSSSPNPYAGDSFSLSSNQTTAPVDEADKKAGFFKRMGNSIGNAFGKMADWVGLGTISHYAKSNFTSYDADKSNSLNINEFSVVSQMIGKSFQQVDSNANQEISLGEFKKIVGDLVDSNFKALDTNSDGFLNLNEAGAGGYVIQRGVNNTFTENDKNQDALLSRNEFAGLVNEFKLKKNI